MSKENWSAKENIIVSGYKIQGSVVSSSGQPLTNVNVELHFSDNSYAKIDTKQFGCDLSIKSALKVCHVKTDSAGQFQFMNIAYGKYKLTSSYASENGKIKFQMQPESISVDLTGHQDVKISEQFKLSEVIVSSQASVKKNVNHFFKRI